MSLFVDMGWGDWRVADEPNTRVTQAQVDAVGRLEDVESIGASEVRFGDMTGELCVFHADGRTSLVAEDGSIEPAEPWKGQQ